MPTPNDILDFWLCDHARAHWFNPSGAFDAEIRIRFMDTYKAARDGKLDDWAHTDEGLVALIIVLDQFPRNLFRDSAEAYATDSKALRLAQKADTPHSNTWPQDWRYFARMPFMHSEDLARQNRGVQLFEQLGNPVALDFMKQHRGIISRFGHFPHRNDILDRPSTVEEKEFMKGHEGF